MSQAANTEVRPERAAAIRPRRAPRRRWMKLHARLNAQQRSDFYLLLANFTADGIPLFEAMSEMDRQFNRFGDRARHVTGGALLAMRGEYGRSLRLGEAIAEYVPEAEAMLIDAGEQCGNIADGLRQAARIATTEARIRSVVREEMFYPAFLFLLIFLFLYLLSTQILPMLEEVSPRMFWPGYAQKLGLLADNVQALLTFVLGGLLGSLVFYHWSKTRWTGRLRTLMDHHVFPWTVYSRTAGAIFITAVAAMMRVGIPFSTVIERQIPLAGPWMRGHLQGVRSRLRRGVNNGAALAGDLFEPRLRWQIELYGRMTDFTDGLERLAQRSVEESIAATRSVFAVLRTVAMFIVAGSVIWTYASFLAVTMAARGG